MLPAIDLNNEPMFQTNKINNISLTWRLPTKVKSLRLPSPQMIPDFHLLRC